MPTPLLPQIDDLDPKIEDAVRILIKYDNASASLLQRRLSIGYARAARLIDQLELLGVVGSADGANPRDVLIRNLEDFQRIIGIFGTRELPPVDYVPQTKYILPSIDLFHEVEDNLWNPQFFDIVDSVSKLKGGNSLPIVLGQDENAKLIITEFDTVPNLIIVGNPLSHKENFVDTLLMTLLLLFPPDKLKLIVSDSTHYFDVYQGIPHLLTPIINDGSKTISALRWTLSEVDRRLKLCSEKKARSVNEDKDLSKSLDHILIVTRLDYESDETTSALDRITEIGPRVRIHNIIIVNRFNDTSISSSVKSSIPHRLVYRLSSGRDSKVAGVKGADELSNGEFIHRVSDKNQKKFCSVYTPLSGLKKVLEATRSGREIAIG